MSVPALVDYFRLMARTDITMTPDEVQEFLAQPQSIQVATILDQTFKLVRESA